MNNTELLENCILKVNELKNAVDNTAIRDVLKLISEFTDKNKPLLIQVKSISKDEFSSIDINTQVKFNKSLEYLGKLEDIAIFYIDKLRSK